MKELEIQWTTMKAVKNRDGFSFYYVAFPQDPSGTFYDIFGTNQVYIYRTRLEDENEITDFETNFKDSGVSVASDDDAIALAVPAISAQYMPNQVWVEADLTSSATTKEQIVVSYTVPDSYDFYILTHSLARITDNGMEAVPAALEVVVSGTTIIKIEHNVGVTGDTQWESVYTLPLKLATARNVVKLVVTPSGLLSTVWSGRITGFLRSL